MGCGASGSRPKLWGTVRRAYERSGIMIDNQARNLADKADYNIRKGSHAIKERLELHVIIMQKYLVKIALSKSQNVPRCDKQHILLPVKIVTSWECRYF